MNEVPFARWKSDLLALYEPPMRAALTFGAMKGVMRDVEACGVETTAGIGPELVGRFIQRLNKRNCNGNTIRGRLG